MRERRSRRLPRRTPTTAATPKRSCPRRPHRRWRTSAGWPPRCASTTARSSSRSAGDAGARTCGSLTASDQGADVIVRPSPRTPPPRSASGFEPGWFDRTSLDQRGRRAPAGADPGRVLSTRRGGARALPCPRTRETLFGESAAFAVGQRLRPGGLLRAPTTAPASCRSASRSRATPTRSRRCSTRSRPTAPTPEDAEIVSSRRRRRLHRDRSRRRLPVGAVGRRRPRRHRHLPGRGPRGRRRRRGLLRRLRRRRQLAGRAGRRRRRSPRQPRAAGRARRHHLDRRRRRPRRAAVTTD